MHFLSSWLLLHGWCNNAYIVPSRYILNRWSRLCRYDYFRCNRQQSMHTMPCRLILSSRRYYSSSALRCWILFTTRFLIVFYVLSRSTLHFYNGYLSSTRSFNLFRCIMFDSSHLLVWNLSPRLLLPCWSVLPDTVSSWHLLGRKPTNICFMY